MERYRAAGFPCGSSILAAMTAAKELLPGISRGVSALPAHGSRRS